MIVGEAPGEEEDRQGAPFVGRAGQLLDRMLASIDLTRSDDVAARRIHRQRARCRPPANRNPLPQEVAQCEPYLLRQMALVRPKVILAMGRFAVQSLLKTTDAIGRLRGRVHEVQGIPVVVTTTGPPAAQPGGQRPWSGKTCAWRARSGPKRAVRARPTDGLQSSM